MHTPALSIEFVRTSTKHETEYVTEIVDVDLPETLVDIYEKINALSAMITQ
jgi:hypothetical protein